MDAMNTSFPAIEMAIEMEHKLHTIIACIPEKEKKTTISGLTDGPLFNGVEKSRWTTNSSWRLGKESNKQTVTNQ